MPDSPRRLAELRGPEVDVELTDRSVLVQPLAGGEAVTLSASRGTALAAAFAADGTLAVAHVSGVVELWDVAARERLATLTAPGLGPATAVIVRDEQIVVGHASGALLLHPRTAAAATARAEAVLARRTIGNADHEPPQPSGWYGHGRPGPAIKVALLGDSSAAGYGVEKVQETPGAHLASGLAEGAELRQLIRFSD